MGEDRSTAAGLGSTPLQGPIASEHLGHATVSPTGSFEAGSFQTFTLVYTAGTYGIDDSGSLRVCFRFASDQSRPQFEDPKAAGYTTVVASNGAVLETRFDPKGNVRPWDRTLYVKVVSGFLSEGDTITLTFGDTSQGSPGIRMQTFCEDSFEFHTLVDPIATFNYQPVPDQPVIALVPGTPVRYVAVAPTCVRVGEAFAIKVRGEDRWGNPSDMCDVSFSFSGADAVSGLPDSLALSKGAFAAIASGASAGAAGDVHLALTASDGLPVTCNPIRVIDQGDLVHFWGDLHGQSEETIGTNSARAYFEFARDKAFVDACAHQGNDFQMTTQFWDDLNAITKDMDEAGRFVALPGYEWSGNTALGGDRNVFFPNEGRTIRRSSHAMIEDHHDIDTDCVTSGKLFEAFADAGEMDVVCFAHCGGRYADIKLAHDGRFEKSVEVHSAWGTFEWLVQDALESGYRVGIVGNSDGHKGRPGASYPGAGKFGAIGGLTCYLMPELSRDALLDCLRKRRHYATTGGPLGRLYLDVRAAFGGDGEIYHDDPALGPAKGESGRSAMMGDIVHLPDGGVKLSVDVVGAAPIERVDIFNGLEHVKTVRPYGESDLGNRIRVMWEGAEYRGRFRQVVWDGTATFSDARIVEAVPINFLNPDKTLDQTGEHELWWQSLTTGNTAGFEVLLDDGQAGDLRIETPLIMETVALSKVGYEDVVFDASDRLPRQVKVYRLPDTNPHTSMTISEDIPLRANGDNAIFVRVIQQDGTRAWSSPIYVYR